MGHAHGIMWDEEKILEAILHVKKHLRIDTMPTKTQMIDVTGSYALSCAISKRGGTKRFAELLGLEIKASDSKLGEELEIYCMNEIISKGYLCNKMPLRHPYDLLVDKSIKIDVKTSNIFKSEENTNYYTFNLSKKYPTCDLFICYCLDDMRKVVKTYIIPSSVLSGKTQLSIGMKNSKYDKYIDRWDILDAHIQLKNLLAI